MDDYFEDVAAKIHRAMMSPGNEHIRDVVEFLNKILGESPEAVRGAMHALMTVGSLLRMADEEGFEDRAQPIVVFLAAWQTQPHVMAVLKAMDDEGKVGWATYEPPD